MLEILAISDYMLLLLLWTVTMDTQVVINKGILCKLGWVQIFKPSSNLIYYLLSLLYVVHGKI